MASLRISVCHTREYHHYVAFRDLGGTLDNTVLLYCEALHFFSLSTSRPEAILAQCLKNGSQQACRRGHAPGDEERACSSVDANCNPYMPCGSQKSMKYHCDVMLRVTCECLVVRSRFIQDGRSAVKTCSSTFLQPLAPVVSGSLQSCCTRTPPWLSQLAVTLQPYVPAVGPAQPKPSRPESAHSLLKSSGFGRCAGP